MSLHLTGSVLQMISVSVHVLKNRYFKYIYLLKSELFTKKVCRDETCSLIFFNCKKYHALRANVLSTVSGKNQQTCFLYIDLYRSV